jgi:hypothetical protein
VVDLAIKGDVEGVCGIEPGVHRDGVKEEEPRVGCAPAWRLVWVEAFPSWEPWVVDIALFYIDGPVGADVYYRVTDHCIIN